MVVGGVVLKHSEDLSPAISALHLASAFSRTTASHVPLLGRSLLGLDGCLTELPR